MMKKCDSCRAPLVDIHDISGGNKKTEMTILVKCGHCNKYCIPFKFSGVLTYGSGFEKNPENKDAELDIIYSDVVDIQQKDNKIEILTKAVKKWGK